MTYCYAQINNKCNYTYMYNTITVKSYINTMTVIKPISSRHLLYELDD